MIRGERRAVIVVSIAALFVTSTWLSGTAALPNVRALWQLSPAQGAWLTNATQLGFIAGTFLYAVTNLSDYFSARWVFALSAAMCALSNLGFALLADGFASGVAMRRSQQVASAACSVGCCHTESGKVVSRSVLALGPAAGLYSMYRLVRPMPSS